MRALHVAARRGSLAWRLAVALATIVLMFGVVSVACIWALFDIHDRLHAVKNEEATARRIVRLASAVRDQYAHVAHTIILGDESHAELFRDACRALAELAEQVGQPSRRGDNKNAVADILKESREIQRLFEAEVLPLVRTGQREALIVRHERILGLAMSAQKRAEELAREAEESMDDLGRHMRATQHGAIFWTLVAHALAVSTSLLIGFYLYRSIARPIRVLSEGATRVGAGDLDTSILVTRNDELGQLAEHFNQMVSSLKEHEARLVQTEKLAGLGRFAAGLAHELNNPIGVISGYAKLLRRRAESAEAHDRMLTAIEDEAERCRQVIEGLLQLTRGGGITPSPVRLRALLDDVVARLRLAGLRPGFLVRITGDATVSGDPSKLTQVFTNLICNAAEASPSDGEVAVVIASPGSGRVTVAVSDAGPGIKPEDQDRVFEPFFTTKPTGTGLGLPIARAIARAHGGDLKLIADVSGTTFELTLPSAGAGVPA